MTDALIQSEQPHPDRHEHGDSRENKPHSRRRRGAILSEDDCLERLSHLSGLVAAGILAPAQANAIRGSVNDILSHSPAQARDPRFHAPPGRGSRSAPTLNNPAVFNLLEPLLTDEQLNASSFETL